MHFELSAFFAIQIMSISVDGVITCLGGSYVASGANGNEKLRVPMYYTGLKYLDLKGPGEVQNPIPSPQSLF